MDMQSAITPGSVRAETVDEIVREVHRGRTKFPGNELLLTALTEEVGELAKALLEESPAHVAKEAAQVAAVAIRIIEEGDPTFNPWRIKNGLEEV